MLIARIDTNEEIAQTNEIEKIILKEKYNIDMKEIFLPDYIKDERSINAFIEKSKGVVNENKEFIQFVKSIEDVEGMITSYMPASSFLLKYMPKLKVISLLSTGYNTVDLTFCKENNIKICHIPDYCTHEVAEHATALLLVSWRKIINYNDKIREKIWSYSSVGDIHRLYGKRICLFGFGKIAKEFAQICNALGLKVGVVSEHLKEEEAKEHNVEIFTCERAQNEADIICNHMALTQKTEKYYNKQFFDKLKRHPLFINVGRGGSVDETALAEALEAGKIIGAALDVLSTESPDLDNNLLCNKENVIMTPHAAFYSVESMYDMCDIAVANLINALNENENLVNEYVS